MKFKQTRELDPTKKYVYYRREYTDFYCSISEWAKLGRGKSNFIYQLRTEIANNNKSLTKYNNAFYYDGTPKLSLDRTGIRDSYDSAIYSGTIIKEAIKLVTHSEPNIVFDSHKGIIKFVIISFPNKEMPNIVVIINEYSCSSTNYTIMKCLDAIYKTLQDKLTDYYNGYLKKYYCDDYDRYFYVSREDMIANLTIHKRLWKWEHVFHKVTDRQENYITIDYDNDYSKVTV